MAEIEATEAQVQVAPENRPFASSRLPKAKALKPSTILNGAGLGSSGAIAIPLTILLSLTAIGVSFVLVSRLYIHHDVGWYLYAARTIDLSSCRLYENCFLEPNPPLILWVSVGVTRAGDWLHLDPIESYRAFVLAILLGVGGLLYFCFKGAYIRGSVLPLALASGYVACASVLALTYFGQRDHLVAVLIAPYIALQAAAARKGSFDVLAAMSGVLAGIAVALKPHAALIIVACEIWRMVHDRSLHRLFRVQTLAIIAVGVLYLAAVALWAPGYFNFIKIVGAAYPAYSPPLVELLSYRRLILVGFAPAVAALITFPRRSSNPAFPFALAGLAATAVYFLQHKGFGYHALPAQIIGTFAILYAVMMHVPSGEDSRARAVLGLLCIAVIFALNVIAYSASWYVLAVPRHTDARPNPASWLIAALNEHGRPGARVGLATTSVSVVFPGILYSGHTLANRMPALWLLPALVRAPAAADTRLETARDLLFTSLHEDFVREPPELIVEQRGKVQAVSDPRFSPLAFLSVDRELGVLFGQYKVVDRYSLGASEYVIYARRHGAREQQGQAR